MPRRPDSALLFRTDPSGTGEARTSQGASVAGAKGTAGQTGAAAADNHVQPAPGGGPISATKARVAAATALSAAAVSSSVDLHPCPVCMLGLRCPCMHVSRSRYMSI